MFPGYMWFLIMLFDWQYLLLSSFLIFLHYVHFYAPIYQGKLLVCDNLVGNKPDSDLIHISSQELNIEKRWYNLK